MNECETKRQHSLRSQPILMAVDPGGQFVLEEKKIEIMMDEKMKYLSARTVEDRVTIADLNSEHLH